MSLDRRLREGLERLAGDADAGVESDLDRVVTRGRRQRTLSRFAVTLAAVTGLVLAAALGPQAIDFLQRGDGQPADEPVPAQPTAIAGTYSVTLLDSPGTIRQNDMAGTWTLTLDADRTLSVDAPSGFAETATGYSFELPDQDTFRTDLFVNEACGQLRPGTYRWVRGGDGLSFSVEDEPCAVREALFTTATWIPRQR
jgi:hypothetical protein